MKKIACFALLALLFSNCKKNDSNQELKSVKTPIVTNTAPAVKEETKEKKSEKTEDCKDIEVEMGSGKECLLKNTNLNRAYLNIIKNKEVEESDYFLSALPNQNKSVEINKNGLISIDYEIIKDKVTISMNYEGGLTEVILEKINNTVKRSIYHYAD